MVAQPDSSPAVAPSATTMSMKRDVPEGNSADRSASVKSTRISDAAAEMLSPVAASIGDFAALAATPHGTPVASLAPTGLPQVAGLVPTRATLHLASCCPIWKV